MNAGGLEAIARALCLAGGILTLLAMPVRADPSVPAPRLELPIDCDAPEGCLIQNYFDHDPTAGFADYTCGVLGYDGHKGIDFRLPNLAAMHRGVPVRAAAAGRVRATRDEMPDVSIRDVDDPARIDGREAGNSVAVEHGGGWETQYSHLMRGSVRVRPGQQVEAGQVIGLVGLSGKTEFPHLHLAVRLNGEPVDPFVGPARALRCGEPAAPLWSTAALRHLSYRPTGLIQAGFSDRRPEVKAVEAGGDRRDTILSEAQVLAFWVEVYGVQQGDEQVLALYDPRGRLISSHRQRLPKDQAKWFSYIGKKRRTPGWPPGRYRSEFTLSRTAEGETRKVVELSRVVEVRPTQ